MSSNSKTIDNKLIESQVIMENPWANLFSNEVSGVPSTILLQLLMNGDVPLNFDEEESVMIWENTLKKVKSKDAYPTKWVINWTLDNFSGFYTEEKLKSISTGKKQPLANDSRLYPNLETFG